VKIRNCLAIALAPVLLAGCNDEPAQNDDRTASGEVLEGSVSDAMIPLEQLKSQPPLARAQNAPAPGDEEATPEDPAAEAAGDPGPGENPILEEGFEG
jgi:hypothetical protein